MSGPTERPIVIALTGNPNSGKTTVFNAMTGARQRVANYPGVTVEKKEGYTTVRGRRIKVVDLPGTYSLTAYSIEELVSRDFIIEESPDVVVDIIDSSNLERNLYLGLQLLEMGVPVIFAFNMSDEARRRGLRVDHELLSELLGVVIVPTVGSRGEGIDELLEAVVEVAEGEAPEPARPIHVLRPDLERERQELIRLIEAEPALADYHSPRWLAMKLLENDEEVRKRVQELASEPEGILSRAEEAVRRVRQKLGEEPEFLIADHRYGVISGACQEAVVSTIEERHSFSDQIDKVLTNRLLGIPIFLAMMWLVFQLTFGLGQYPMTWLEMLFGWLGEVAAAHMPDGLWKSLITDALIGGVGGVIVFLPNILLLFFAISVLEDTGYMARAAFIMDRVMHTIGLHGKSFIPMLVGFGCTVPAIMATRTLESKRDRYTTMLVLPFMSCGARLPVYTLLAGAFFAPHRAGNVIFAIYLIGVAMAVLVAKAFRSTLFRGANTPFLMELPPYRVPTLKSVLLHMWRRAWMYLKKAGTIILVISVVIWLLGQFPRRPELRQKYMARIEAAATEEQKTELEAELEEERLNASYAGRIGHAAAYVLKPTGLGDWKIGTALFAGVGAKEVIVATFGTLYSVGEGEESVGAVRDALRADPAFSPLVAFTLMVFVLLYAPCMPTVAVFLHESRSWGWTIFLALYTTGIAWLVSVVVYRVGLALGLG